MNIKQRSTLSNRFYQIGYFLVVFLFAIVAVSTLFFAIGIPILRANVVIAFLVTCFWMHKEYPDDSDQACPFHQSIAIELSKRVIDRR